jgi:hypothetical protein
VEREAANDPRLPNDANDPTLPTDSTEPILPIERIELSDAMESSELRDHSDRRDVFSEAMSASLGQAANSSSGAPRERRRHPLRASIGAHW